VRCALGLNRSALVVALALVDLTGDDPATVIQTLRRERSQNVLFNEAFEQYALHS
jgi:protein-tyrosine phosphatase